MQKVEQEGQRVHKIAGTIVLSLLAGLLIIEFLKIDVTIAAFTIFAAAIFLISLDGYRIWAVLLTASLFSGMTRDVAGFTFRPEQIIFLFVLAGFIVSFIIGRVKFNSVPMFLPIGLFIGINFLSSGLYSYDHIFSYRAAFLLSIYMLMYVITVVILQEYPQKIKKAVKFLLIIGVCQSLYALITILAYYSGVNLGALTIRSGVAASAQGSFQESDILGAFSAVMVIMFFAMLAARNTGLRERYLAIGLVITLLTNLLAYTRASWIGLTVALGLLILLQQPKKNIFNPRAAAVLIAITLGLSIFLLPGINNLTSGITGSVFSRATQLLDFSSGSGKGRVNVQEVAIDRWEETPLLGSGTLSFPKDLAATLHPGGPWLYSSFIQALHDSGIVGLALLLWIQGGIIYTLIKAYKRTTDSFYRASLSGFIAGSVALIIASQASSFIWLGFPWIFSGLAVAVAKVSMSSDEDRKILNIEE